MIAVEVDPTALARVAEVARRYLPAFLAGERADADLYADGAVTWHAATGTRTPIDPSVPSQGRLREHVPDLRHEDVRVHVHAAGFTVQAAVVGTVLGTQVRVETALFVAVEDGRITGFEEYADRRQAAPFLAAFGTETPA